MAQSKVLLHNVPDFGNCFVTFFFIFRKFCTYSCFAHNAICNIIQGQKLPVRFSEIPFICKYLFDGFFRMTTSGNAKRKIRAVMMGIRRYFRSQDESLQDIYGSMFLQTEMSDIIFSCPVRFPIAGEFKRLAVLSDIAFGRFAFSLFFLHSLSLLSE